MRYLTRRLALVAVGICALLAPAAASANSTEEQITAARNKGITYFKELQNKETGAIPGFGGDWSLAAFAAAKVAPADVNKGGKATTDARSWYEKEVGVSTWPGAGATATDYERGALLTYAAGIDPARVSKRQNLIAKVASNYQTASPGYYGSTFNATVFGLLALADTKTKTGAQRVPQVVLNQAIEAVRANQHTDGGWTWEKAAGSEEALKKASEPDMTGAAMAALCTAGVANTDEAIVKAKSYLSKIFVAESGAFESAFGVNTDSNAWAVDGLKACEIDPQQEPFTTEAFKKTPIDFLISQQVASGGFRYLTSGSTAEEYASQDAVRALGSGGFTATPPKPSGGGEQWTGASQFAIGKTETTSLALIVEDGVSALKVCSVSLAPQATTTTLEFVLNAAVAGTVPTGCVTSYKSEGGAITQINGSPSKAEAKWNIVIDGGEKTQAKLSTTIHVGDTIYLKFN